MHAQPHCTRYLPRCRPAATLYHAQAKPFLACSSRAGARPAQGQQAQQLRHVPAAAAVRRVLHRVAASEGEGGQAPDQPVLAGQKLLGSRHVEVVQAGGLLVGGEGGAQGEPAARAAVRPEQAVPAGAHEGEAGPAVSGRREGTQAK